MYFCDNLYEKHGKSEGNYFLPGGQLPGVIRFQNLYKLPPWAGGLQSGACGFHALTHLYAVLLVIITTATWSSSEFPVACLAVINTALKTWRLVLSDPLF